MPPAAVPDPGADPSTPVVLFANAPCADVNHIDFLHAPRQAGLAEAARVGTILAGEVVKGACRLVADWESEATGSGIHAGRRSVDLPLRRPTPEQVAWARQAAQGRMTMVPGAGLEVVEAHRVLGLAAGWTGGTRPTEVQALTVGDDLAVVGLPGESLPTWAWTYGRVPPSGTPWCWDWRTTPSAISPPAGPTTKVATAHLQPL